jgi:negative regulator of sigma E activity
MTPLDPKTREQLCAWMDGELPPDEARFFERRLANDAELRAQWERWQLASACMRGQSPLPMRGDFSERVLAAISAPQNAVAKRRPILGWAIAASIAALALMVGVQMRPEKSPSAPNAITRTSQTLAAPINASPASADLVALNLGSATPATVAPENPAPEIAVAETPVKAAAGIRPTISNHAAPVASLQSPMPLNVQSPTEFPLLQASEAKTWPRSPVSSGNDASMEAYLVRHNEMVSDGGLGGFVPYVDVVTRERDGASDAGAGDAGDAQVSEGDKQ